MEKELGEPLPLLLLEATPLDSVPPALQPLYRSTRKVLGGGRKVSKPSTRRAKVA